MIITDGLGNPTPPLVSREMLEQQRACGFLAFRVSQKLAKHPRVGTWSIEVDIAPTSTRFVVFYLPSGGRQQSDTPRVEVDFGPGDPIHSETWLTNVAQRVIAVIDSGDSDFFYASSVNFLRLTDNNRTIFASGKAWE